eukprot:scaffold79061_cov30-Tisochrysis_lutea.AAC.8
MRVVRFSGLRARGGGWSGDGEYDEKCMMHHVMRFAISTHPKQPIVIIASMGRRPVSSTSGTSPLRGRSPTLIPLMPRLLASVVGCGL